MTVTGDCDAVMGAGIRRGICEHDAREGGEGGDNTREGGTRAGENSNSKTDSGCLGRLGLSPPRSLSQIFIQFFFHGPYVIHVLISSPIHLFHLSVVISRTFHGAVFIVSCVSVSLVCDVSFILV